ASRALFDSLAPDYDQHFDAPHRAAYDRLAWKFTMEHLPPAPAVIVEVGCGIGRWSSRFVDRGYRVIGLEPAPSMAAAARRRLGSRLGFELVDEPIEDAVLEAGRADAVVAMGSFQYAEDSDAAMMK